MPFLTRRLLATTALSSALGLSLGQAAWALPQNGSVAGGSATIAQTGSHLDINQSSTNAVIDWQSFSIAGGESVGFHQPSATALAVNRVTGVDPSVIAGSMTANGRVVLVNPNGVL